ncbi:hypothetical protein BGW38_007610, partial [Lunasporangiospora selenospora]
SLPLIKADASDPDSLDAMVAKTKVVISTVGPFIVHGEPLVNSCVKHGTHYVDSTGESPFVKRIIDKYHKEAEAKKVIVVSQCGFDSVPSDIGTKMVVDFIRKEYNLGTQSVKLSVTDLRGEASGGTLASACEIIGKREGGVGDLLNQNSLVPESVADNVKPARITVPCVNYDRDFLKWQGYFVMSSSNEKIVKRSHGLALEADGEGYGKGFSYYETMSFPGNRILPAPGTGPSDESIAKGRFTIKVVGESTLPEVAEGEEAPEPVRVMAVVRGGEPGYSETCRYLVECAMCLVDSEDRVREENKVTGGVLTPAHAFGQILIRRLLDQK